VLDDHGVGVPYSLAHTVHTGTEAQLYSHIMGTAVERPDREADQSPHSSTNVKNVGVIHPLPPYVFIEWCLIKHKDNFTFTSGNPYCMECKIDSVTVSYFIDLAFPSNTSPSFSCQRIGPSILFRFRVYPENINL
jgi:hypothetical protein